MRFSNKYHLLLRSGLRTSLVLILVGLIAPLTLAQQSNINLTNRRQPIEASILGVYQTYEEDTLKVSEMTLPFNILVPFGRNMSLTLRANQAHASSDQLETLTGLSDAQGILSIAHRLGSGSLVFSFGFNLPIGKEELTPNEFQTVVFLSQTAFDYRVPSFGQGPGVSPTLTWAFPVSRSLVVGLGASYQYRGSYKPIVSLEDDYTPGNEILLTGGLDTRLGSSSALSLDVSHTLYAADKFGDEEVFQAGGKTTATVLIRHFRGFNEWRLLGLFRTRGKASELADTELVTQDQRTFPNEVMVRVSYRTRLRTAISVELLIAGHRFEETELVQSRDVFDLGLLPTFRLSSTLSLSTRFIYTAGTITGFEVGGGLVLRL